MNSPQQAIDQKSHFTSEIAIRRSNDELQLILTWLYRIFASGFFPVDRRWNNLLVMLHQILGLQMDHLIELPTMEYEGKWGSRLLATTIRNALLEIQTGEASKSRNRLQSMADAISLSAVEQELLQLLLMAHSDDGFKQLLHFMDIPVARSTRYLSRLATAVMLDISLDDYTTQLSSNGTLIKYGLLAIDNEGDAQVSETVLRYMRHGNDQTAFVEHVAGKAKQAVCVLDDFTHLGSSVSHIASLLARAAEQQAMGINVLLYGPSGTGKTELAAVIAASIGCCLHGICESPDREEAPDRAERIQSMLMCQRMMRDSVNTLLTMDEADDVLTANDRFISGHRSLSARSYSKIFMTRLLENNPVPMIWIINEIDLIDPALLRRMSYALKMPVPAQQVRARIWSKALADADISATPTQVNRLASELHCGPAIAASAITIAKLQDNAFSAVETTAYSIATVMQGGKAIPRKREREAFDVSLISGNQDFGSLHMRASAWRDAAVSFCISGPSGTGKSLALRALADQMNREVLHCRASTLLGSYVGETEANIAEAFSHAESDGLFLIIDEAETLLAERRHAEHNWERSQTAEFLTWMEQHPLPFGISTNHLDLLDMAMLRRFTFKLAFEAMGTPQLKIAFERFFKMKPPALLHTLKGLTTGDFAVVAKRAHLMGFAEDAAQCLNALGEELAAKTQSHRPIGFLSPSSGVMSTLEQGARAVKTH